MCGIAGFSSFKETPDPRLGMALSLLGVFNEDRGKQAWGWTDGVNIVKDKGKFRDSFNSSMLGSKSAIIHTRHATFGAQTAENAHPFEIKGIIGVHNGMIYNHKDVAEKYEIAYQVDSEVIFHAIADKIPMNELHGYGAISFYRDGEIHIGKFSTRGDMSVAWTAEGLVWSSDKYDLKNALDIVGLPIEIQEELPPGKLFVLEGDFLTETTQDMKLGEYVPKTGPTDWRDFKSSSGWTYDTKTGRSYYTAPQNQLPLPTAETTTFTSEPGSDNDEVIDVTDGVVNADFTDEDAIREMYGKQGIDVVGEDGEYVYAGDNFFMDAAELQFAHGVGQCDDCLIMLMGENRVYVNYWTDEVVCDDCYNRNYAHIKNPGDDREEEFLEAMDRDEELAWEEMLEARADSLIRSVHHEPDFVAAWDHD